MLYGDRFSWILMWDNRPEMFFHLYSLTDPESVSRRCRRALWAGFVDPPSHILIHRSFNYPETQSLVTWARTASTNKHSHCQSELHGTPCGPPPPLLPAACPSTPLDHPLVVFLFSLVIKFIILRCCIAKLLLISNSDEEDAAVRAQLTSNDPISDLMTALLVWEKTLTMFLRAPEILQGFNARDHWGSMAQNHSRSLWRAVRRSQRDRWSVRRKSE